MKNIRFFFFLLLIVTLTLSACQKDIPEPENIGNATFLTGHAFASELTSQGKEPIRARYLVKNDNVFVECMIKNFSFLNEKKSGVQNGKMLVFVDQKLVKEVTTAAFSIKGLSKGNHRIMLKIVGENGQPTSLKKEFIVTIP